MNRLILASVGLFALLFVLGFLTRSQMAGALTAGLEHAGLKPMHEPEEATS